MDSLRPGCLSGADRATLNARRQDPAVLADLLLLGWLLGRWRGGTLLVREVACASRTRRWPDVIVLVGGPGSIIVDLAFELVRRTGRGARPGLRIPTAARWCGLGLALAGAALTAWGRMTLGLHWRTALRAPSAEQLRMTGAYGFIRHPIYAGAVAFYCGVLLAQASPSGVLVFLAHVAGYIMKTRAEDGMLTRDVATYRRYRDRVRWRLFPGLW